MEQQRYKRPIVYKRKMRKPTRRKKPEKILRMKCDNCSKKFWPEDMYVKHKPVTYMYTPNVNTEGMHATGFKLMYADKRLRPFHDRKCNVLIVCGPCFQALKKKFEKS